MAPTMASLVCFTASTHLAREIAEQLFVSTNTVKTQPSIYRKLGVSSRARRCAADAAGRR
jgi:DNA-binding NarL/FixJ family response regulator